MHIVWCIPWYRFLWHDVTLDAVVCRFHAVNVMLLGLLSVTLERSKRPPMGMGGFHASMLCTTRTLLRSLRYTVLYCHSLLLYCVILCYTVK